MPSFKKFSISDLICIIILLVIETGMLVFIINERPVLTSFGILMIFLAVCSPLCLRFGLQMGWLSFKSFKEKGEFALTCGCIIAFVALHHQASGYSLASGYNLIYFSGVAVQIAMAVLWPVNEIRTLPIKSFSCIA